MLEQSTAIREFAQAVGDTLCAGHLGLSSPAQRKINLAVNRLVASSLAHEKAYSGIEGVSLEGAGFITEEALDARIEALKAEIDEAFHVAADNAGLSAEALDAKLEEFKKGVLSDVAALKVAPAPAAAAAAPAPAAPAAAATKTPASPPAPPAAK